MKRIFLSLLLLTTSPALIVASETTSLIDTNEPLVSDTTQATIGRNVFRQKLRRKCGLTGARFAQTHTLNEWQELKEEGNFRIEIYKICPKTATVLKDDWIEPLYEFSKAYASDTGNFPSC
ncbi:cytochrome C [Sulfurovum sp. zt1-1]|uniref:Cytochrome C n=1 Tax=Sulfurovum zhangzhouensis TaxID=3019067 RepID=A0ABT7QZG5_9BACT|nr:cytochrome C [Sulfurovum zhangzhouensis]MDM5272235.1 cytochrome C [Sulfurovum zhangzhouensis]